jgi:hypothetical protein
MGSRVVLRKDSLVLVNPLCWYEIPYGSVARVGTNEGGTLAARTVQRDEFTCTGFGGSLIDRAERRQGSRPDPPPPASTAGRSAAGPTGAPGSGTLVACGRLRGARGRTDLPLPPLEEQVERFLTKLVGVA